MISSRDTANPVSVLNLEVTCFLLNKKEEPFPPEERVTHRFIFQRWCPGTQFILTHNLSEQLSLISCEAEHGIFPSSPLHPLWGKKISKLCCRLSGHNSFQKPPQGVPGTLPESPKNHTCTIWTTEFPFTLEMRFKITIKECLPYKVLLYT